MNEFVNPGRIVRGGGVAGDRARGTALLLGVLLAAALLKLILLLVVGASIQPDSPEYISLADGILAQGAVLQPFDFSSAALPHPVFRMIGYPLIIAGAKLFSPIHWAALLVLLQGAVTLVTSAVVFSVLQRLFASTAAAAFTIILYLGSGSLLWDNSILSDSLYASFFNLVIFALLGDLIGRWRIGLAGILGLAVLWSYSLILRDSGTYFTILPLILLGARAWQRRDGWLALAPMALFIAVIVGTILAYMGFNHYRTGAWFFGITGVANWLRPVFDMAKYGYAQPFTGNDLVSTVMRSLPAEYEFPAQMRFLDTLHAQCRCTPLVLQTIVFEKFAATVAAHPFAYLAVIWRNINYLGLASLLADPVTTLNQFIQLGVAGGTASYRSSRYATSRRSPMIFPS